MTTAEIGRPSLRAASSCGRQLSDVIWGQNCEKGFYRAWWLRMVLFAIQSCLWMLVEMVSHCVRACLSIKRSCLSVDLLGHPDCHLSSTLLVTLKRWFSPLLLQPLQCHLPSMQSSWFYQKFSSWWFGEEGLQLWSKKNGYKRHSRVCCCSWKTNFSV